MILREFSSTPTQSINKLNQRLNEQYGITVKQRVYTKSKLEALRENALKNIQRLKLENHKFQLDPDYAKYLGVKDITEIMLREGMYRNGRAYREAEEFIRETFMGLIDVGYVDAAARSETLNRCRQRPDSLADSVYEEIMERCMMEMTSAGGMAMLEDDEEGAPSGNIHEQIRQILGQRGRVISQAMGRVGEVIGVSDDGASVKIISLSSGRTAFTSFLDGDPVVLQQQSNGDWYIENVGQDTYMQEEGGGKTTLDRLVDEAKDLIEEGGLDRYNDLYKLPNGPALAFAYRLFTLQVMRGGFSLFFDNGYGADGFISKLQDALAQFGGPVAEMVERADQVFRQFEEDYAEAQRMGDENEAEYAYEVRDEALDSLDSQFYQVSDRLENEAVAWFEQNFGSSNAAPLEEDLEQSLRDQVDQVINAYPKEFEDFMLGGPAHKDMHQMLHEIFEEEMDHDVRMGNTGDAEGYIFSRLEELGYGREESMENTMTADEIIRENVNVDEAEVVMALRAQSNILADQIEKLGRMINEDLIKITEQISNEMGQDTAAAVQSAVTDALQQHLDSARSAKEAMDEVVSSVAQGQAPGVASPDLDAEEPGGDMPDMDLDLDDEFGDEEMGDQEGADINEPAASGPTDEPMGRREI